MTSSTFASAQQRVAERQRQRQLQAQSNALTLAQQQATSPLQRIGQIGSTTWNTIRSRGGTRPAFRVGQVDAELLDEELLQLLKAQVADGLKYFGTHVQDDWSAEILLALRAILFKISVWDKDATYGAALQNLRFTDARNKGPNLTAPAKWQKALYGVFSVGGKYAWTRWENYLVDLDNGYEEQSPNMQLLSRLTETFNTLHSTAAFASFLVFLVNGRYRTLLDRMLRLRLAPPTSQVSREVSFEYLNRQLVWHAMTEFLLFLLPLVGISRWRRWLSRAWRKTKSLMKSEGEADDEIKSGEFSFLPERTCAICYQDRFPTSNSEAEIMAASGGSGIAGSAQTDITNPYETVPCACIYCYVCLAAKLEAEEGEGWTCLRCGKEVTECKPWGGDVIEDVVKSSVPSMQRAVSFAEPMKLDEVEPRSEDDDGESARGDGADSSHASELGDDEAFDEAQEGDMELDEDE